MTSKHTSLFFELVQDTLSLELVPTARVAILHFTDSKTRNSITLKKSQALADFAAFLRKEPNRTQQEYEDPYLNHEFTVLALRSSVDGVFISGGSLKEIPSFSSEESNRFITNMRQFSQLLRSGSCVSVSLLNGLAVGGGAEVALATDLRFSVSAQAAISLAQTKWGVPAGWGMMQDLRSKGVYSSERRRGIAMASQELWNLTALNNLGLVDAECSQESEASWFGRLETLAQNLTICPDTLRAELIQARPQVAEDELDKYDQNLFDRYWMKNLHLKRVESFLSGSSKSKRSQ